MFAILPALLPLLTMFIDKAIPDKGAADKIKLELIKADKEGLLKQLELEYSTRLSQMEVNKIEAASENMWKSGWRPAAGWICVLSFGYIFLLSPMLSGFFSLFGLDYKLVVLDTAMLMTVLLGMLGLGAYRSFDKIQETDRIFDKNRFYTLLVGKLERALTSKEKQVFEDVFKEMDK